MQRAYGESGAYGKTGSYIHSRKLLRTEEEREKSRQEYLDRRGIPESFRW